MELLKTKRLQVEKEIVRKVDDVGPIGTYQRRNNPGVVGTPEKRGDDTYVAVLKMFKDKMQVDVGLGQVERSHRVGRLQSPGAN